MSYKSVKEILNAVFDSSDSTLKTVFKTDGEVFNLIYDESANALRVNIDGFSGGGGIIDGEAAAYADLPPASEHTGEIYIVQTTTGILLINRKQAGMYRSDGAVWTLLDVDLQADKVYYSGDLTSGNVQDALNELKGITDSKAETSAINEIIDGTINVAQATNADTLDGKHLSEISSGIKNYLINGCFRLSQRGDYTTATASANNGYYVDRWKNNHSVACTIQHLLNQSYGNRLVHSIKLAATASATGYIGTRQQVENPNQFAGKTLTMSVPVRSNSANARLYFKVDGSVFSTAHSGSGEIEVLTVTATASDAAKSLAEFGVYIIGGSGSTVVITAGEYVEIMGEFQLEEGEVATPFEHRHIGLELAMCQRYFRKHSVFVHSTGRTSFPINMRAVPTITGGGVGFISIDTTEDMLNCYQTTGAVQVLTLAADL